MTAIQNFAYVGSGLAGLGAVGGAVIWLGAVRRSVFRRVHDMLTDWSGSPARPGVGATPGVMERIASLDTRLRTVEAEVTPNGGHSLKDAVARTEQATRETRLIVEMLAQQNQQGGGGGS